MDRLAGRLEREREQLLRTIGTLEAQRSVLGDSAVDLALGPVRTRLAEFDGSGAGPDPPDLRSEHKVVTVLFVDVSGFTAMSERLESEEVRDILNGLFERLVPIVERYGGVIDKFMGDEIMALFGAPRATEHHADHALRACLDMFDELSAFNEEHDRALGLHIGVNSGLVVAGGIGSNRRQDYSVMGDAVNIAARLEDASGAGEILVGPASYRATASSFDFDALPPILLKGKAQPLPVYRLLSARQRKEPTSDGFTLAFEGRHNELDCLVNAVRSGAPALMIVGQPGLGKSRLLRELRQELGSRWPWLEVAAMSHRSSATYAVLHDLFDVIIGAPPGADADELAMALADHLAINMGETAEEHGPYLRSFRDLPPINGDDRVLSGLTPDVIRQRLHRAVAALFATAAIGTRAVICIEDLHWADASSIGLLADIVAKGLMQGATLVVTSRVDVSPVVDSVRQSGDVRFIKLDPLDADAVAAVLDRTFVTPNPQSWLRAALLERSEGNPFYLVSFLQSLVDDGSAILEDGRIFLQREPAELRLPDSLHAVVAERIDRLDAGAKAVLRQASIIGRRFRTGALDRLAAASGAAAPAAVLGTLLERQLIEAAGPDHLQFVHAVVQDVVYQGMLARERRRLHTAVASLLVDEPNADDAVIAWHLELAGNELEASRRYEQAAQRAQKVHANQDALAHVEKAIELVSGSDHARLLVLNERAADLVYVIGRFAEAADRFALLAGQSSGIDAARLCRKHAHSLMARQQIDPANAQLAIARSHLAGMYPGDRTDPWWREHFAVECESLWALYLQARAEEMRTAAANIAPALEERGTPHERSMYYRNLALLELRSARMTATPETVRLAELAALEIADGPGGTSDCFTKFTHAFTLLWSGDRAGAERRLLQVLEQARRIGDAERHLLCLTYLAVAARFRHDVESARAFAVAGAAAARLSGARLYEGVSTANLAWVAWRQGEVRDRIEEQLSNAKDLMSALPGYPFLWIAGFVEVAIAAADGDLARVGQLCSNLVNPFQQRLPDDVLGPLERVTATPTVEAVTDLLSAAERVGYL